nr:uncharacterized protein LOC114108535 [Marmota flaviventris]
MSTSVSGTSGARKGVRQRPPTPPAVRRLRCWGRCSTLPRPEGRAGEEEAALAGLGRVAGSPESASQRGQGGRLAAGLQRDGHPKAHTRGPGLQAQARKGLAGRGRSEGWAGSRVLAVVPAGAPSRPGAEVARSLRGGARAAGGRAVGGRRLPPRALWRPSVTPVLLGTSPGAVLRPRLHLLRLLSLGRSRGSGHLPPPHCARPLESMTSSPSHSGDVWMPPPSLTSLRTLHFPKSDVLLSPRPAEPDSQAASLLQAPCPVPSRPLPAARMSPSRFTAITRRWSSLPPTVLHSGDLLRQGGSHSSPLPAGTHRQPSL